MNCRLGSLFFAGLLVLFSFILAQGQPSSNSSLDKEVSNFEETHMHIAYILQGLAKRYKVPIGVEIIPEDLNTSEGNAISLNIERGTVREVLNTIIKADPRYEWAEVDGVINVSPKQQKDPLLETVVESFQVDQERADFALSTLMELPAVKNELQKRGLVIRTAIDNVNDIPKALARPVHLSRSTVRQILNKLMQEGDRYYWIFLVYGDRHQYLHIAI